MNLETLEAGLLAWLATLTEVPATCVVKANGSRPVHTGQLALAQWVSLVGVGVDATLWDYDAGAVDPLTELTPSVTGPRRGVLQVDVEVHDQRAGYDGSAIAQRIVDRCRAPSSLTTLQALNAGLAGVSPVRRTDYPFDGRMIARATVEVSLNLTSLYEDTAGRTATIESVTVDATVLGVGGTEVADSIAPGGTFDGP